jgi:hypothetical protein
VFWRYISLFYIYITFSYIDSVSRHSSVQGESDSEPEVLATLSNNLHSILSSESSDDNMAASGLDAEDDDAFDSSAEKPVFLTAKGPVAAAVGTFFKSIEVRW